MTRIVQGQHLRERMSQRSSRIVIGLAVAALLLSAAYRIACIGLAENFARSDAAQALRWSAAHPTALRARAEALRRSPSHDPREVEALLRHSLAADPVDGRSFGWMGLAAAAQGRDALADKLLEIGVRRAPRDFGLRLSAMTRSLRANRLDDATRHLVAILQVDADRPYRAVEWLWYIYVGSSEGKDSVARIALAPSAWRVAFLRHVAANSPDPAEVLKLLGNMDRHSVPASSSERDAIFDALVSRLAWRAAFVLWVQDPELGGLRRLPNVFNGDFESELNGRPGFDWLIAEAGSGKAFVEQAPGGGKSLRIDVPGGAGAEALLSHRLLLGEGRYTLSARARSQGNATRAMPYLLLRCVDPGNLPLATLEMGAKGRQATSGWQRRSLSVDIPRADCAAQLLEIHLSPAKAPEARGPGSVVWLDDVALVRTRASRIDRADVEPGEVSVAKTAATRAEQVARE